MDVGVRPCGNRFRSRSDDFTVLSDFVACGYVTNSKLVTDRNVGLHFQFDNIFTEHGRIRKAQ